MVVLFVKWQSVNEHYLKEEWFYEITNFSQSECSNTSFNIEKKLCVHFPSRIDFAIERDNELMVDNSRGYWRIEFANDITGAMFLPQLYKDQRFHLFQGLS